MIFKLQVCVVFDIQVTGRSVFDIQVTGLCSLSLTTKNAYFLSCEKYSGNSTEPAEAEIREESVKVARVEERESGVAESKTDDNKTETAHNISESAKAKEIGKMISKVYFLVVKLLRPGCGPPPPIIFF